MPPRRGTTDWQPVVAAGLRDLEDFPRASIQLMRERVQREHERQRCEQLRLQDEGAVQQRRAARLRRNEQIAELHARGWGYKRIARHLRVNPYTIRNVTRQLVGPYPGAPRLRAAREERECGCEGHRPDATRRVLKG